MARTQGVHRMVAVRGGFGDSDILRGELGVVINTDGIDTDISRDLARRAYSGISFSPERRSDSDVAGYIEAMKSLAEYIVSIAVDPRQQEIAQTVFDGLRAKYKAKTIAMLSAQSRCISPMITGPANFPVRRAEKANASERKRTDEWLQFHDSLRRHALKSLSAVMTDPDANKDNTSQKFTGLEVVFNRAENRLQLLFDEKPSDEVRDLLKKAAFKWSPRFGAWQRQLTGNATHAFSMLLSTNPAMQQYKTQGAIHENAD